MVESRGGRRLLAADGTVVAAAAMARRAARSKLRVAVWERVGHGDARRASEGSILRNCSFVGVDFTELLLRLPHFFCPLFPTFLRDTVRGQGACPSLPHDPASWLGVF